MDFKLLAAAGRLGAMRPDAALAAFVGLSAVTAAYAVQTLAAAPQITLTAAPASAPAATAPPPATTSPPAEPEPFLIFGEPLPGHAVNSPFGLRRMPWEAHGRLHEGVDIAAPGGTPVRAAASGVVTRAGVSFGYGRFVEVRHAADLVTLYAHLGKVERHLKPGVAVEGGSVLGRVGSTGTSTGPHLHFEVRRDGRPLDPAAFMGRRFATVDDLPLKTAARYSRRVRVAQVSVIPKQKQIEMAAREAGAKAAKAAKAGDPKPAAEARASEAARPRAILQFAARPPVEAPPPAMAASAESQAVDAVAELVAEAES
ncbi:MAG: M23 family metallopeptidase [Phenylobacterium sp.]|uniref:M23 family metallopeptidase n=1 Tax=Phenylobacterium sp. TaxID=1871053 RepID=UPI00391BB438